MNNQELIKDLVEIPGVDKIIPMIKELDMTELGRLYDFLETRRIVRAQSIPSGEQEQFIRTMYHEKSDKAILCIDLYNYGRIQGIREERAKRKKHQDNDLFSARNGCVNKKVLENAKKQRYLDGLKKDLEFRMKEVN